MQVSEELIRKYNQSAPRYTSYPTVPLWKNNVNTENWEQLVSRAFSDFGKEEGISIYIHLPFCESLCTYCGCNKRITKNNAVKSPYIEALILEWNKYKNLFNGKVKIAGIHLGGGTPTFFEPKYLSQLITAILEDAEILPAAEFSFEGHPNNTTYEHLQALNNLGFDRVSYGIQDFDMAVQRAIHRIQPLETVRAATDSARELGYKSINYDLIYGLPHQTEASLRNTFAHVKELKPDRIAFYSYAHLPSVFPSQKSFERFLPSELEKKNLYNVGKALLVEMGYQEIGMDHFALPNEDLYQAKLAGKLHRNFMGYTTLPSKILIGLGASSISDVHYAYAQNEKAITPYQNLVNSGEWAIRKGHILSNQDLETKKIIMDLICKSQAEVTDYFFESLSTDQLNCLIEMEQDGLVNIKNSKCVVTELGMSFIRTICKQFDLGMTGQQSSAAVFSKTI